MPRDLKEPEGWRFSSLRKMRLERGLVGACGHGLEGSIPAGGFGEGGGLYEGSLEPGGLDFGIFEAAHDLFCSILYLAYNG